MLNEVVSIGSLVGVGVLGYGIVQLKNWFKKKPESAQQSSPPENKHHVDPRSRVTAIDTPDQTIQLPPATDGYKIVNWVRLVPHRHSKDFVDVAQLNRHDYYDVNDIKTMAVSCVNDCPVCEVIAELEAINLTLNGQCKRLSHILNGLKYARTSDGIFTDMPNERFFVSSFFFQRKQPLPTVCIRRYSTYEWKLLKDCIINTVKTSEQLWDLVFFTERNLVTNEEIVRAMEVDKKISETDKNSIMLSWMDDGRADVWAEEQKRSSLGQARRIAQGIRASALEAVEQYKKEVANTSKLKSAIGILPSTNTTSAPKPIVGSPLTKHTFEYHFSPEAVRRYGKTYGITQQVMTTDTLWKLGWRHVADKVINLTTGEVLIDRSTVKSDSPSPANSLGSNLADDSKSVSGHAYEYHFSPQVVATNTFGVTAPVMTSRGWHSSWHHVAHTVINLKTGQIVKNRSIVRNKTPSPNLPKPTLQYLATVIPKNPASEEAQQSTSKIQAQIDAVKANPASIVNILDPCVEVQVAAVTENAEVIAYITNPCHEAQVIAVKKLRKKIFEYTHCKLVPDAQVALVKSQYDTIALIDDPCEEAQLLAVSHSGKNVRYINRPTLAVQKAAVKHRPENVQHIKKLSTDAFIYLCKAHPGYCGSIVGFEDPNEALLAMAQDNDIIHETIFRQLTRSMFRSSETVLLIPRTCEKLVAINRSFVNFVERVFPAVAATLMRELVEKDPQNIQYIEKPPYEVQMLAVERSVDALVHVKLPHLHVLKRRDELLRSKAEEKDCDPSRVTQREQYFMFVDASKLPPVSMPNSIIDEIQKRPTNS